VLATVSDRKLAVVSGGLGIVDYYDADVTSTTDYYPYGMTLRSESDGSNYRYGFQGQEMDDEVKGEGNSYTTHFRQLDPRIGRWLSIDPKATAWETPYASMGNNPIFYNDVLGDSIWFTVEEGVAKMHFQGKVIDLSGDDIDIDKAIADIEARIESDYQGRITINGVEHELITDVDLEGITDLNYVNKSDHLIVFAKALGGDTHGVVSEYGGKTMFLRSSDWASKGALSFHSMTKSASHEFGHLLNLGHYHGERYNIMKQGYFGASFNSGANNEQLQRAYRARANMNKGFTRELKTNANYRTIWTVFTQLEVYETGAILQLNHEKIQYKIENSGHIVTSAADRNRKSIVYPDIPTNNMQDNLKPNDFKPIPYR
jgi:RHS repeat-associated protein